MNGSRGLPEYGYSASQDIVSARLFIAKDGSSKPRVWSDRKMEGVAAAVCLKTLVGKSRMRAQEC